MRVIPVIDLMAGQVVRGIAGRRETYRPLRGRLTDSASPLDVAAALVEKFGIRDFYLADLDAIAGAMPAFDTYRALFDLGLRLIVDAGLADRQQAQELAEFTQAQPALTGVIAGLESLGNLKDLEGFHHVFGADRLIFSLDLMGGTPRTVIPALAAEPPHEIAAAAVHYGVRRLIVLDLAQVGSDSGSSTLDLCRRLRDDHASAKSARFEIISGGGVRGAADLQSLASAGCDGALVASALHDGKLTSADLRPYVSST